MNYIHLDEVKSTNSWLLSELAAGAELPEWTVVWTKRQTAGRGQIGNSWEAEPDKNVSFSVLLRPDFIAPRCQFVLSQLTALAVADALPQSVIKWPNDIFVNEGKICGMLIENQLMGSKLAYSVVGIGINVNQRHWVGNAPNPTSLSLITGTEHDPEHVMQQVVANMQHYYQQLLNNVQQASDFLHQQFLQKLYWREEWHDFVDAQTGEPFRARIHGVEPEGPLLLQTASGEVRSYMFKEVKFVLPCGVTKE